MRLAAVATTYGDAAAPAGVGGPGAALQRHRRCSRRWPPVRLCWVGERSRSGGRASAATARSCGSSVARCARRRGVRRRCPGRCTVGRAARRGSRAPSPHPHLAIIGLGVFMGYLIPSGLGRVELLVRPPRGDGRAFFDSFPLFPLCMIGGLMVQRFVATCTQRNPIDHYAGWRPAFCLRVWSLVPTVSGTRTVALHSQESRANAPGESGCQGRSKIRPPWRRKTRPSGS